MEFSSLDPKLFNHPLNSARTQRKVREYEESQLSNRVKMLQIEIARSKKRLADTEHRTKDLLAQKAEERERQRQMELERKRAAEEHKRAQLRRAAERHRMEEKRTEVLRNVFRDRRAEARKIKQEAVSLESEASRLKAKAEQQARRQNLEIRKAKAAAQKKRMEHLMTRVKQSKDLVTSKVHEENSRSKHSEQTIHEMEATELELLQHLEKLQTQQRNAYKQLEVALGISAGKTVPLLMPPSSSAPTTPRVGTDRSSEDRDRPSSAGALPDFSQTCPDSHHFHSFADSSAMETASHFQDDHNLTESTETNPLDEDEDGDGDHGHDLAGCETDEEEDFGGHTRAPSENGDVPDATAEEAEKERAIGAEAAAQEA